MKPTETHIRQVVCCRWERVLTYFCLVKATEATGHDLWFNDFERYMDNLSGFFDRHICSSDLWTAAIEEILNWPAYQGAVEGTYAQCIGDINECPTAESLGLEIIRDFFPMEMKEKMVVHLLN